MTASVINVTIGSQIKEPDGVTPAAHSYAPTSTPGVALASVSTTNVAADVATLVADGASPTQAHVTTLSGHWTTLLAAITANNGAITGDCQVQINSNITTATQLKAAFAEALRAALSAGIVTP